MKATKQDLAAVREAQSLITSADVPLATRLKITAQLELLAALLELDETHAARAAASKIGSWRARRSVIEALDASTN